MPDFTSIEKELYVIIGRLRHRITIQEPVEGDKDSQGKPVITWTEVKEVWASIEPMRGKELYEVKQINTTTTHKVIIRYYSGLLTKYRILFGERIFGIDNIINISERNILMELLCEEKI